MAQQSSGNNTNLISSLSNVNCNPSNTNGILSSGNTTTNNLSYANSILNSGNTTTNSISGRKGRSNWRKMSYAEREGLFLEVAIYINKDIITVGLVRVGSYLF